MSGLCGPLKAMLADRRMCLYAARAAVRVDIGQVWVEGIFFRKTCFLSSCCLASLTILQQQILNDQLVEHQ